MASISNAINMSFRVDKDLKKQADTLFKELGLNTSVALNMFLTQSVREQALPFTPSKKVNEECELCKKYSKPSRSLKRAMKEADDIISGKKKSKAYHSVEELIEDLDND